MEAVNTLPDKQGIDVDLILVKSKLRYSQGKDGEVSMDSNTFLIVAITLVNGVPAQYGCTLFRTHSLCFSSSSFTSLMVRSHFSRDFLNFGKRSLNGAWEWIGERQQNSAEFPQKKDGFRREFMNFGKREEPFSRNFMNFGKREEPFARNFMNFGKRAGILDRNFMNLDKKRIEANAFSRDFLSFGKRYFLV
ncbi:unnamed protein product [Gongylonema pulchrum]|uniref:FMRFamide-related neuropeptides-like n=1 Tax=Gongylonema pulchrum TaxID=637853 RepID=A0A183DQB5_9BILA|nr:unnamed protein product [Gongylonema pulchrum]